MFLNIMLLYWTFKGWFQFMQEIKLNDINLDKFEKCKIQGTKSITYYNENYCIKIPEFDS